MVADKKESDFVLKVGNERVSKLMCIQLVLPQIGVSEELLLIEIIGYERTTKIHVFSSIFFNVTF